MKEIFSEVEKFKSLVESKWLAIFERIKPLVLQEVNKDEDIGRNRYRMECHTVSFKVIIDIGLRTDIVTHKVTEEIYYRLSITPLFRTWSYENPGVPELEDENGAMLSGRIEKWLWDNIKEYIDQKEFPHFKPPVFTS